MPNCIFCKILSGEIPSFPIWENEKFVAILDAFPNRKGQALVLPKDHYDSDLFAIEETGLYESIFQAGKEVAKLLKKGLNVERVAVVVEWMEVPHLHLRLYPLYPDTVLEVKSGEKADVNELEDVQKLLR